MTDELFFIAACHSICYRRCCSLMLLVAVCFFRGRGGFQRGTNGFDAVLSQTLKSALPGVAEAKSFTEEFQVLGSSPSLFREMTRGSKRLLNNISLAAMARGGRCCVTFRLLKRGRRSRRRRWKGLENGTNTLKLCLFFVRLCSTPASPALGVTGCCGLSQLS